MFNDLLGGILKKQSRFVDVIDVFGLVLTEGLLKRGACSGHNARVYLFPGSLSHQFVSINSYPVTLPLQNVAHRSPCNPHIPLAQEKLGDRILRCLLMVIFVFANLLLLSQSRFYVWHWPYSLKKFGLINATETCEITQ